MNAKALVPLIAGLGIGGLALKMGMDTLKRAQGAPRAATAVEVWVPTENIPRGTEVLAEKLRVQRYPLEMLPAGVVRDKQQIVGRVVDLDAVAGLPILESMLLPPGERVRVVPKPGFRAVAVKVDESSGVDGHLEPGCYVDVSATVRIRRNHRTELAARTILENVQVLAVGPRITPQTGKAADEKDKGAGRNTVRAVTLSVRPEDVQKLLLAEQEGKIKLSLRNADERGPALEPEAEVAARAAAQRAAEQWAAVGELLNTLVAGLQRPARAANPPPADPPWVVPLFKGDKRSEVVFKNRASRERLTAVPTSPSAPPDAADAPTAPPVPELQTEFEPEPQEFPG